MYVTPELDELFLLNKYNAMATIERAIDIPTTNVTQLLFSAKD